MLVTRKTIQKRWKMMGCDSRINRKRNVLRSQYGVNSISRETHHYRGIQVISHTTAEKYRRKRDVTLVTRASVSSLRICQLFLWHFPTTSRVHRSRDCCTFASLGINIVPGVICTSTPFFKISLGNMNKGWRKDRWKLVVLRKGAGLENIRIPEIFKFSHPFKIYVQIWQ